MIKPNQSVSALVSLHSECAAILARAHVDFCCRGDRTLNEACASRGVNVNFMVTQLQRAVIARNWRNVATLGRIGTNAHAHKKLDDYDGQLRTTVQFLNRLSSTVVGAHGERYPELVEVDACVKQLVVSLFALFALEESPGDVDDDGGELDTASSAEDRWHPEIETRDALYLFGRLRQLTDNYGSSLRVCSSYSVLQSELAQLERDVLSRIGA